MQIIKTNRSRLKKVNFSNLPFGTVFSDHMFICKYKDGKWVEPKIIPYGPIEMNPGAKVLHYGQSIFEGMKAFKNSNNELLLFRKEDNFIRLNKSAIRLSIPQIPKDIFMNGLEKLISLDNEWCKKDDGYSLYIRPFVYASEDGVKASTAQEFTFIIITSPSTRYYSGDINLLVEEKYTRAPQGGVGFAKAAGNYAASFYPTRQANKKGFQQVVWTDSIEHKYIEECGTMNIWFRIGDKLVTPQLSDSILDGITRKSVIALAKDMGIDVQEKKVSVKELFEAYNDNKLTEVFGSGTAVGISPIRSITFRSDKMSFTNNNDSISSRLKSKLQSIQKGEDFDSHNWITKIH